MSLIQDVTFESLGAVKQELHEWLGSETSTAKPKHSAARDALIAVIIHSLAQELSDVRAASQIQAILTNVGSPATKRFED
jgi:hypothetical protein